MVATFAAVQLMHRALMIVLQAAANEYRMVSISRSK
jgi:hypothetical protein